MKKKFSGFFGILLSLAMICSLIMIPLTAQAVATWEEVWSEDFDNLTQNQDGTYNLGDFNTTALEIDPATFGLDSYQNTRHAYLTTDTKTGEGYALQLTHTASSTARIPVRLTFDGTSLYKITYDWLTNAPNEDGKKSRVKFLHDTSYCQVTKSAGKPYLTVYGWGTETEVPQVGEWVQAEIIFNSASKHINIKWIKSDGTVIMNRTGMAWSDFDKINSIELVGEYGGQKIDNIIISKAAGESGESGTLVWSEGFDTQPSYGTYTNMEYVSNGSGYALATKWSGWNECLIPIEASVPENAGKGVYKLTYDWYVEQAGTNAASLVRGIIGFEDASGGGYCVGEVASKIGEAFAGAGYPVPDTSSSIALLTGRWYKAEVTFDFTDSNISYILYDDFDDVVVTAQRAMDALTSLAQVHLSAVECKMRIDNMVMTYEGEKTKEDENAGYEAVWSENFDSYSASDSGNINLGGENTNALEINPAVSGLNASNNSRHAYLTTRGSGYALKLTHTGYSYATIPVGTTVPKNVGAGKYKLTYDWLTNCAEGEAEFSMIRLMNGTDFYMVGARSRYPSEVAYNYAPTALTDYDKLWVGIWYNAEILLDFENSLADYTLYYQGNVVYTLKDQSIANLTSLTGIGFEGIAGGMTVDNIVLYCIDEGKEEEVNIDSEYEETIWTKDFDDAKTDLGGENTNALEINPAVSGLNASNNSRHAYLSRNGSGYALTLTHTAWSVASFAVDTDAPEIADKGKYKLTYDWYPNCNAEDGAYGMVKFICGADNYGVGIRNRYPSNICFNYMPTALTTYTALTVNQWYNVAVIFDFDKLTMDYVLSKNGSTVYSIKGKRTPNLGHLDYIGLQGVAGGMTVDNFILKKIYEGNESPSMSAENVRIIGNEVYENRRAVPNDISKIAVNFIAPMDTQTLTGENIYITNKATGAAVSCDLTTGVDSAYLAPVSGNSFDSGSTYVITVKSDCAAKNGDTLTKDHTFEFTVADDEISAEAAAVKANGVEITSLAALRAVQNANIEIIYSNETASAEAFFVTVAYYSQDNRLIKHEIIEASGPAGASNTVINIPYTVSVPENAQRLKIMTWQPFTRNKPMGDGLSII